MYTVLLFISIDEANNMKKNQRDNPKLGSS